VLPAAAAEVRDAPLDTGVAAELPAERVALPDMVVLPDMAALPDMVALLDGAALPDGVALPDGQEGWVLTLIFWSLHSWTPN
jgi:hypothetical protein